MQEAPPVDPPPPAVDGSTEASAHPRPAVIRAGLAHLTSILRSRTLGRARQARSVEAIPSAIPEAHALFDMDVLAGVLGAPEPDALVVDRGRTLPLPVPRTRDEAREALGAGHSIVVRRAEQCDLGLRELADEAATVLRGAAHVQLFVTPAGAQSFGWHYDAEDVFIVQTRGEKDYFFRQNTQNPEARGPLDFSAFSEERSPLATCTLIAGDLLFLPRGWWHVARSRSESWSISLGITLSAAPSSPAPRSA